MSKYGEKPWLRHYSSFVPGELPAPEGTLLDQLLTRAKETPDAPAFHYFDVTVSYHQLDEWATRLAAKFAQWGVGRGDRVAIYTQNNPAFLIGQYAAWKRGAIVVPLNPMFKEKELEYHLNDSGAKVMVALESLYETCAKSVVPVTCVQNVVVTHETDFLTEGHVAAIPMFREIVRAKQGDADDLMEVLVSMSADDSVCVANRPDDIAFLVYTSGTTGNPKGAMNLHRNVLFNATVYQTWMQMGEMDRILGLAPLFHITGLVGHVALSMQAGAPLVLCHRFDPQEVFRLIQMWQPTMTVASITAFIALMNHPASRTANLQSLTKCYSGGAPIPPSLTEQFEERFGVYIHNIYGLTESNSPTHAVPLYQRAPVDPQSGALSIGLPVPNCEARIVEVEDPQREVSAGMAGEYAVRGPMIFAGYWNKPEATEKAFHEGYFLTGDVAVMDEDGWFYIVDRKKDMIIASGFKVWPREVEDMLYQHPAVKEAAVIGVPDAYRGETVKAFIAVKDEYVDHVEPEEIIQFCKKRMAAYKYPRQVVILPELPKTATGKFLRRELRAH